MKSQELIYNIWLAAASRRRRLRPAAADAIIIQTYSAPQKSFIARRARLLRMGAAEEYGLAI